MREDHPIREYLLSEKRGPECSKWEVLPYIDLTSDSLYEDERDEISESFKRLGIKERRISIRFLRDPEGCVIFDELPWRDAVYLAVPEELPFRASVGEHEVTITMFDDDIDRKSFIEYVFCKQTRCFLRKRGRHMLRSMSPPYDLSRHGIIRHVSEALKKTHRKPIDQDALKNFIDQTDLCDIYRIRNGEWESAFEDAASVEESLFTQAQSNLKLLLVVVHLLRIKHQILALPTMTRAERLRSASKGYAREDLGRVILMDISKARLYGHPSGKDLGGTHASPYPHKRKAHLRKYTDDRFVNMKGKTVQVRLSWVGEKNWAGDYKGKCTFRLIEDGKGSTKI